MRLVRSVLPLAALAAACATPRAPEGPRPITPETGPQASIRVGYMGGLLNRTMNAHFRVEQASYVLVAHLGGDGIIRVLYPETPWQPGWVAGKRTVRTGSVSAPHDGLPGLFSYTTTAYRNPGAMYASYDGRGHGYVFLIASRRPLRYGMLEDESGQWSEWEIEGYEHSYDPRQAVRDFADAVAGSGRYTLKYAGAMTTTHYDQVASRSWDCALLSSFGALGSSYMWMGMNSWYSPMMSSRYSLSSYCGYNRYTPYRYALFTGRGTATPPPVATIIPAKPPAPGAPAPELDRPGRRGLGSPAPTQTRQTITRVAPGTSTGEATASRGRPTYGSGRSRPSGSAGSRYGTRDRDPVSSPRDRGSSGSTSTATSSRGSGSSGSTSGSSSSGSSSSGSSSRGSESRGVTSPREARRP